MLKALITNLIRLNEGFKRGLARAYYSLMLEHLGRNCQIDFTVHMPGVTNISIGDNCVLNRDVLIQSCDEAKVKVGNGVILSYGVKVITGGLNYRGNRAADRSHISHDIEIKDNVWIGANSTILPGVVIGESAVVAAGSVITKDVTSHCLVGGVPAKILKHLNENDHCD